MKNIIQLVSIGLYEYKAVKRILISTWGRCYEMLNVISMKKSLLSKAVIPRYVMLRVLIMSYLRNMSNFTENSKLRSTTYCIEYQGIILL
jgi:hypothetical protein